MNNFSNSLKNWAYIVLTFCSYQVIFAQNASDYNFSQTVGTYTPIVGGLQAQPANDDDEVSSVLDIGFTFKFFSVDYTQFSTCSNGWIRLGSTTATSGTSPISSTNITHQPSIAFFARDGKTGGVVTYQTTGTAPDRVLTVQYNTYNPSYLSSTNYMNVQVKLYETINKVEIIYGSSATTSSYTAQVGIAKSNINYSNRTTTTDWLISTVGASNTSTMTFSSTVKPAEGLTYSWTPASCFAVTPVIEHSDTIAATISWVNPLSNPVNGYEYYYSTSNTAPTAATVGLVTTDTFVSLINLNPNTNYYFWVRSVCSASDISAWSPVLNIYTSYCVPTGSTSYYLKDIVTTNAVSNIGFHVTSGQGYRDSSIVQLVTYPTNQITYTLTPSTGTNYYYIWVDWNNDLDFDDVGETILAATSYTSNYTGTLTIPSTQALGNYRMRVANSWSGAISSACGSASSGSFVDFTLVVVNTPTCSTITGLVGLATSNTEATLTWIAPTNIPANGYEYYISTSNAMPTLGTIGTTVTGASTSLTNLTPNTTYYVWVRGICSATDVSYWSSSINIYTGYCVPTGSSTYYLSSFTTNGASTNINHTATSAQAYRDNSATQLITYPTNQITYTLTPSAGTNYYYIWIDWNNDLDFNDAGETILATTSYTSNYTGTLTIPSTQALGSYRMRVAQSWSGAINSACGPAAYGSFVDFTLVVGAPPSCLPITSVNMSLTSATSGILTWTPISTTPANGYEYYISTSSAVPTPSTVGTSVIGTNVSLTNLTPNTTYYVWVRGICSATDIASWSNTTSFFTNYCVPTGSTTYYLSSITTQNALQNLAFTNTTSSVYLDRSTIQMVSYAGNQFNINIIPSNSASQLYYMWVDWNNDLDFDDIGEAIFATTSSTTSYTGLVTVPLTQSLGSYRVRISMATSGGSIPVSPCSSTYGRYVDFTLVVDSIPSCLLPINVIFSNVSQTSAVITWTAPAIAPTNGYEYYISTTNTTPTIGTTGISVTGTSVNLTGLLPNTTYYVWVRSVCSSTETSMWTSTSRFFTNHCVPVGVTSDYIRTFNTNNAVSNISYTASSGVGYVNNRPITLITYPSNVVNFTMTANSTSNYYYVWIDWNNDLDFNDVGETILATTSYASSASGSFTVPAGQAAGNYIMRISTSWLGTNSACGPASYGNYVDFTITVGAIPTCFTPTGLGAITTSASTANVSWNMPTPSPANGYEYYISTSNTLPTSATLGVQTMGLSASLTNLTPNTTYYVWVRSLCSSTEQSYWSNAVTFYTGACIPTGSSSYYVNSFITTNANTDINYTAASGASYVNNTSTILSSYTGNVVNFTMTANNTSNYFYVWIDWNNDLDFNDVGETILATTSYASSASGSFTVPAGQAAGNYTMRISTSWLGLNTACGPASYGNYIDFTIYIRPNCLEPISLTSSVVNVCSGILGEATIIPSTPNSTTPNFYYEWSNGQTTATATGLSMGYYFVTVTDGGQCSAIDSVVVISSIVSIATQQLQGDCGYANGIGDVVAVVTDYNNIGYFWSTGDTMRTINNLAAGSYTVTVTDQICSRVADLEIYHFDDFIVTADIVNESSDNLSSGSIHITNAVGNANYLWSNGATTSSITGLSAGLYTVTVTVNSGCIVESIFEVQLVTSIDDIVLSLIKAYPNPTISMVNIAGLPIESRVMLINNLGQIIYSFIAQNEIEQIDLSDLAPTTYWIRVENQNASTILPIIRMK